MIDADGVAIKLVQLTREGFDRSLAALEPGVTADRDGYAEVMLEEGVARLVFEDLPAKQYGGVVLLPQARVTLDLSSVAVDLREAALRRFDWALQQAGI